MSRSSRRYKPHRHHRSHGHSRQRRRNRIANAGDESVVSVTDIDSQSEFTSASYTTTDMESVADSEDTVSVNSVISNTEMIDFNFLYFSLQPSQCEYSDITSTSQESFDQTQTTEEGLFNSHVPSLLLLPPPPVSMCS